jgi:hypothetical protein
MIKITGFSNESINPKFVKDFELPKINYVNLLNYEKYLTHNKLLIRFTNYDKRLFDFVICKLLYGLFISEELNGLYIRFELFDFDVNEKYSLTEIEIRTGNVVSFKQYDEYCEIEWEILKYKYL